MAKNIKVVQFPVTVPEETLHGLMASAVWASRYWASIKVLKKFNGLPAKIEITEDYDGDGPGLVKEVEARDLALGLQRLTAATFPSAMKHFADACAGEGDSLTADVVLQMTVFGEIRYS